MLFLLTVRLKKIIYSGDNLGDDLSFQLSVKGHIAHLRSKISPGQSKSFKQILFQEVFPEGSVSLPISVYTTEEDPVFNDTGSASSNFNVQLSESAAQTHSFSASVKASGGDVPKEATFTFILEAIVDIINVEIDKPTQNQVFEIDHDTMLIPSPGIVCEAKAIADQQDLTDQVNLQTDWKLLLTWTGGGSTYYTPGPSANDKLESSSNPFAVPSSAFTTGGDLSVELSGILNGGTYPPISVSGVTIKVDEDPSNADFSAQLGSDIMRAIAWQEWAGLPTAKWNHYDSNGQPLVHGADWGIMQINKPVWEWWFETSGHSPSGYTVAKWNKIAWNWKINIADGKYIHQTYMHSKQTATQKTWPATGTSKGTPNREDLATYGYHHGEGRMRLVTAANWSTTVETDTYTQNVRTYKENKPWE